MIDSNKLQAVIDEACKTLIERRMIPLPEGVPNDELLRLLKDYGPRERFMDNMKHEIQIFDKHHNSKVPKTKERIYQLIAAGAEIYVTRVLEWRRQQIISHAEQQRLANQDNLKKEMEGLVEENTYVRRLEGGASPAQEAGSEATGA